MCKRKARPAWDDMELTDEEDAQLTTAWLQQVELGGEGWVQWSEEAPVEWAREEGLPIPVVHAIEAELDVLRV